MKPIIRISPGFPSAEPGTVVLPGQDTTHVKTKAHLDGTPGPIKVKVEYELDIAQPVRFCDNGSFRLRRVQPVSLGSEPVEFGDTLHLCQPEGSTQMLLVEVSVILTPEGGSSNVTPKKRVTSVRVQAPLLEPAGAQEPKGGAES